MSIHAGFLRPAPSLVALFALACVAWLGGGCSSKSTSPAATVSGPTLAFTFPATGTDLAHPGTSHQFQFTTAGTWDYHCITHATSFNMVGTVIVDPSSVVDSATVAVGAGTGFQFAPQVVTIKPNGFVRWANVSSIGTHTVTRP
jgi:plastocyanin